ncbi:MAG: YhcH/YjgK/YiaL family protein [Tissierellia bacterium]|nr:YhcH/YjgK/YiaL family protein [Tissierellia bacterium]
MKKIIIYALLITVVMACNHNKNISEMNEKQVNEWLDNSEWRNLKIVPDESLNKYLFVKQNIINPTEWKAALNFLKENEFLKIELGKYILTQEGTYVTVSEYLTKDHDTTFYEAHRKYIDIQYVANGEEYIGLTKLEDLEAKWESYSEEKDIVFFSRPDEKMLLADSSKFFVFFPSDAHKPCLRVDTNQIVRKIVIKIPYVQ